MRPTKENLYVNWADYPDAEKIQLRLELLVGTIRKHRHLKVMMILTESSLVSPGRP